MTPLPLYSDLGKKAKDVFSKGYHFGLIKLDCKGTIPNGVQLNVSGTYDQEYRKVTSSLESKYNVKEYDATFTSKFTNAGVLTTEVTVINQDLKGHKVTAGINMSPTEFVQSGVAKVVFQDEKIALNADLDLTPKTQIAQASAVVGFQEWLAGYQVAYDVQGSKLTKSNFSLECTARDYIVHTQLDNGELISGSIYRQIDPKLEAAMNVSFGVSGWKTVVGLGAKYNINKDTAVRAKINSDLQIGLGYQHILKERITVTLSALFDGKNITNGSKVGLAVDLELPVNFC